MSSVSRRRPVRSTFAAIVAASAAALLVALPVPAAQPEPAPKPADNTMQTPSAPAAPAANPKAIPVPDGPVVERKELEGGLIVEEITIGTGYEVKPGGAVIAHYHGTLKADPSVVFDSSFERGEPVGFPLSGVIRGWQQGVPGMKVGGVRRLIIPAALAYGPEARGEKLPANSDLVFIIKLVDALQVVDLKIGDGPEADGQFIPVTTFTVTNEAGETVDKVETSNPYVWLPGEMASPMTGFDTMQVALDGMKVGGKRKIVIPAQFNPPAPPQFSTKRPANVKLTMEVELLALRNLPQQPRR